MAEWNEWSEGWIKEGFYITYVREGVEYFEHVSQRDFGHWEYDWPETINSLSTSGPHVPADLEITRGYDISNNTNQIWQMIFGIKGQVFIYIELPTDLHRHGIPKVPKPSTTMRRVSHFTEWMSPFTEPSFITEHFMMRPDTIQIAFDAYNPGNINHTDVTLNIMLNKMVTERIGTNEYGILNTPIIPNNPALTQKLKDRWMETLTKLYKRQIPHRPITIQPVRAPAEAPGGE
jgi:hypothetical protein